jgi:phospholipid/cholesterol/gamma-HCH transport system permease protein
MAAIVDGGGMTGVAKLSIGTDGKAEIFISGEWDLHGRNDDGCLAQLSKKGAIGAVVVRATGLIRWDSSLLNFLSKVIKICEAHGAAVTVDEVPGGVRRLLAMAKSSPTKVADGAKKRRTTIMGLLERFGDFVAVGAREFVDFVGDLYIVLVAFCRGKVRVRWQDFFVILQDVGVRALPIVALISFLVGVIVAFISILQLSKFGANIYVADLVGISMMREMGCIMTGVILAGRTGAAFAATIGTMIVNDEVYALKTMGIPPMHFLVLPRMVAMVTMTPLLCIFSSFIGIGGGLCAAIFSTDLTVTQYCTETARAIFINDFLVGVVKGCFFGLLVSSIGCAKGLKCGHSAEDVGLATTGAVVVGITAIVVADAVFTVIFSAMGV